ncbi:hypothetical protein GA0061081_101329 [Gilliamella bombicola]|uniref:Uncharacterized protein n=1 Tax=Gilliamella bombicola TaxID=1798182 RepID=A0A1C3ZBG8_9GAMM|nr:hypothetical protein GA0061081_101329 [Gilliamella bombicola]
MGFVALDVLVDGVKVLPSDNVIDNKLSVEVALVRPPSNVKYGALPSIALDVYAVNACVPCVYDNKSSGAKTSEDLDNNEDLDNKLEIGDRLADKVVDFGNENKNGVCF